MKIKVSEATNQQLNWLVAKYLGFPNSKEFGEDIFYLKNLNFLEEIIEDYQIGFLPKDHHRGSLCTAFIYRPSQHDLDISDAMSCIQYGSTLPIAIARCFIFSQIGEYAEVPDKLN